MTFLNVNTGARLLTNGAIILFEQKVVRLLLKMFNLIGKIGNLLLDDFDVMSFGGLLCFGESSGGWMLLAGRLLIIKDDMVDTVSFHRYGEIQNTICKYKLSYLILLHDS